MKLWLAFLFAFVLSYAPLAQTDAVKKQKIDSLTSKLVLDSLHTYRFKKLRPYGNIDNRNSFNKPSNFTGYQLGVIVNEYHTFGLGFYHLNSATSINASLHKGYKLRTLRYNTVFYEYLLFNKRYYEVDLPFEIGYGDYRAKYYDSADASFDHRIAPSFLPLSAGIKIIGKPVRWIGLSLMVGYRYFIEKGNVLNFNGFYFPIGVWADFRQIYRDIKYYGFQRKRYRHSVRQIMEN